MMFTKPEGEDRSSPVVAALRKGAGRVEQAGGYAEQAFGVRLTGRDLATAALVVFFLLYGLVESGASLSGGIFAFGFIALAGVIAFARRRGPVSGAALPPAGPLTGALRKLLWLAGRWWGKILLFYILLFGWAFAMMLAGTVERLAKGALAPENVVPVAFGAVAFGAVWIVGSRKV